MESLQTFGLDLLRAFAVLIAIVGTAYAGFAFVKGENRGGGLKKTFVIAAGTIAATAVVLFLPSVTGWGVQSIENEKAFDGIGADLSVTPDSILGGADGGSGGGKGK